MVVLRSSLKRIRSKKRSDKPGQTFSRRAAMVGGLSVGLVAFPTQIEPAGPVDPPWDRSGTAYWRQDVWFPKGLGTQDSGLLTGGKRDWVFPIVPAKSAPAPSTWMADPPRNTWIGDPLCVAAGWLRLNWIVSLVMITIGKSLRYAAVLIVASP